MFGFQIPIEADLLLILFRWTLFYLREDLYIVLRITNSKLFIDNLSRI